MEEMAKKTNFPSTSSGNNSDASARRAESLVRADNALAALAFAALDSLRTISRGGRCASIARRPEMSPGRNSMKMRQPL
jgi:hypothetical protein